jgi:hypothetical protein
MESTGGAFGMRSTRKQDPSSHWQVRSNSSMKMPPPGGVVGGKSLPGQAKAAGLVKAPPPMRGGGMLTGGLPKAKAAGGITSGGMVQ